MIRFTDGLTLASTKLRTRKVRTIVTILVAALMFGGVFTILLITQGFFQSTEQFGKNSFAGRFIVSGSDVGSAMMDSSTYMTDPELIKKAEDRRAELIANKKRAAAKLGVTYDATTEPQVTVVYDSTSGQKGLSYDSTIAQQVLAEATATRSTQLTFDDFKSQAAPYKPIAYYETQTTSVKDGQVTEMKQGKEDLAPSTAQNAKMSSSIPDDLLSATIAPEALLKLYMIEDNGWTPQSGTVPVLVMQKRAAKLVDMPEPATNAPANDRLSYIRQLRSKAKGATFSVCYRNAASIQQITAARQVAQEIASHKNDVTYQKPSLIYGLPDATTCGQAPVLSDKRTATEKAMTAKEDQFAEMFGESRTPIQHKITYQVVGVLPNSMMDSMSSSIGSGIGQLFSMALSSETFRFAIPSELYGQISDKTPYQAALNTSTDANQGVWWSGVGQYYAEFDSADQARNFSNKATCSYSMEGACEPAGRFLLGRFGSNSIGLDEAKQTITKFVFWLTVVVGALAALIAGLTIGRTIADSRRETAVFRAIGFKRIDISTIYILYTLLLSAGIVIVALVVGYGSALMVDSQLWVSATVQAQTTLGMAESSLQFHFLGFSSDVIWVVLAVFAAGLIGMLFPLLRNIRRNPIRDMRDE